FTLFRPITTLNPLRILRFTLMATGIYWVMISGYRSNLILVASFALVASLIRKKVTDVVIVGTLGFLALIFLVATDNIQRLPFGAQRAMSFLPVNVSSEAQRSAQSTADWR